MKIVINNEVIKEISIHNTLTGIRFDEITLNEKDIITLSELDDNYLRAKLQTMATRFIPLPTINCVASGFGNIELGPPGFGTWMYATYRLLNHSKVVISIGVTEFNAWMEMISLYLELPNVKYDRPSLEIDMEWIESTSKLIHLPNKPSEINMNVFEALVEKLDDYLGLKNNKPMQALRKACDQKNQQLNK